MKTDAHNDYYNSRVVDTNLVGIRGRLAQRESVCFVNIFFEGTKFDSADGISFACNK